LTMATTRSPASMRSNTLACARSAATHACLEPQGEQVAA
jgi:hypothetical protein